MDIDIRLLIAIAKKTLLYILTLIYLFLYSNTACADDIYVADWWRDEIVRYDGESGEPRGVFVRPGGSYLAEPTDVALGSDGLVYVSSSGSHEIRRYFTTGELSTIFVDSGKGTLEYPKGLDFGPDGNLYVVSSNRILKYDGSNARPMGKAGDPEDATFIADDHIRGAVDIVFGPGGDIYVSTWLGRVVRYNIAGEYVQDFVPAVNNGVIEHFTSMAFNPHTGDLYVALWESNILDHFSEVAAFTGPNTSNPGQRINNPGFARHTCIHPAGLLFNSTGYQLFVSCQDNNSVQTYNIHGYPDGRYVETQTGIPIIRPGGLVNAVNQGIETMYVANSGGNDILFYEKYTVAGQFRNSDRLTKHEGRHGALDSAEDLVFGPDGNLYVSNSGTADIKRYRRNTGIYMNTFVEAGAGGLGAPVGIRFGGDGNLYVVDYTHQNIKVYDGTSGTFIRTIEPGANCVVPRYIEFVPGVAGTNDSNGSYLVSCAYSKIIRIDGASFAVSDFINYRGNLFRNGLPCRLEYPLSMIWEESPDTDGIIQVLRVVDRGSNAIKRYRMAQPACEPDRPDGPVVEIDLATPGLNRWENAPADMETVSDRTYVTVPEAGQIKVYRRGSSTVEQLIQPGVFSIPYAITKGPEIPGGSTTRPGIRGVFGYKIVDKIPTQRLIRTFKNISGKSGEPRKSWIQNYQRNKKDLDANDKELVNMINYLSYDQFDLISRKMHSLAAMLPDDGEAESGELNVNVIYLLALAMLATGFLVWFYIRKGRRN